MYKKILVPLDGSSLAESVLPHVQMLAETSAAEIVLLQVVVDPVYDLLLTGPKLAAATRDRVPTLRVAAQIYLDCIAARFKAQDIQASTMVSEGIVAENILAWAGTKQADLIVLATHGVNWLGGCQLGNIAYRILHDASIPVLLIRTQPIACKGTESAMARILIN